MKTKLMALEALMKLPESSSVEDYGINFEIVETFLRQSIEADIAKPVEPFAWCIDSKNSADWCFSATESGVKLNAELMHEDCEKTEPFPVFTTPQETAAAGWMPIDTAPKDGTPVDIWRSSNGGERCAEMRRVVLGGGNVFYEPVHSGYSCVRDATHWMPLPAAPGGAA